MGAFAVSFHFKTDDKEALKQTLRELPLGSAYVTTCFDGWISVYEAEASTQNDEAITKLLTHVSKKLGIKGVSFLVHDSDVARYWLAENGIIVDRHNSRPTYFGDEAPDAQQKGSPDTFAAFAGKPLEEGARKHLFNQKQGPTNPDQSLIADELIFALAGQLGIDGGLALADHEVGEDMVADGVAEKV